MNTVRCAIYTRKSSEEGLEQSFNSLDAQREACAAYVLSQASEGWTALPDAYDDGGLSGGSLERPALQRLLADIAAGRVDIVVVYKVDRLTRSLLDFSKLVEAFDKAGVSFVSVTQSFNTTTSMGRLTLNMLLSFAQFEREVTAERIRDKITASKAKGMWMGGTPPLGYEPEGRSLKIVPGHAALVRQIYERYLAFGNVRLLADELIDQRIVTPPRTLRSGRSIGGAPFSRGQLYSILRSPIYIGRIPHKGTEHEGLHEAIIEHDTWDRVQAELTANVQGHRRGVRTASESVLSGKVFDAAGSPLIASHTTKGSRRYRYYIGQPGPGGQTLRIPAAELEAAVAGCIADELDQPLELCDRASIEVEAADLPALSSQTVGLSARLRQKDRGALDALVAAVRVDAGHIEVECHTGALAEALGGRIAEEAPRRLVLRSETSVKRSGRAVRLVHSSGASVAAPPAVSVIQLITKARRWWAALQTGELDVTRLAEREGVSSSYLTRVVRLAFLSPNVVQAALAADLRALVDSASLTATDAVAVSWQEQEAALLPSRSLRLT